MKYNVVISHFFLTFFFSDFLIHCDCSRLSLWIWDVTEASLSTLIVALDNITSASWRPQPSFVKSMTSDETHSKRTRGNALAFCTGTSRVYIYVVGEGGSPFSICIPHEAFAVSSLSWNCDGSAILLQGNESLVTLGVDNFLSSSADSSKT